VQISALLRHEIAERNVKNEKAVAATVVPRRAMKRLMKIADQVNELLRQWVLDVANH